MTSRLARTSPGHILGAEIHNSSSSTVQVIHESFRLVADLGADAVLAPVSWALFEPEEGRFDFSLVEALINTARSEKLRLIPLWFGSWKNGMSTYVPAWIKQDVKRFPRAQVRSGSVEHLSPFSAESRRADSIAFAALMARLARSDLSIPMVQVENEVGLLGGSRDLSALAEAAFQSEIPSVVLAAIVANPGMPVHTDWVVNGRREHGSWEQVLGGDENAEEAFMAHAYATYINQVAASGRAEFDVPLIVNAWLDSEINLEMQTSAAALAGGQHPGTYPSGGPLPRVAPIWKAVAPEIDLLAPDIYFGSFGEICHRFREASGALFIPEMRRSALGVAQMFLAVGEYGAIGVSPFGVDSLDPGEEDYARLQDAYRILSAAAQALGVDGGKRSRGFLLDAENPSTRLELGGFDIAIQTEDPFIHAPSPYPAYGLILEERPGCFLVGGRGFSVSFPFPRGGGVGILCAEELSFDGDWRVRRRLNGDETGSGGLVRLPALNARQSKSFPIPATIESTGIVRIELYRF